MNDSPNRKQLYNRIVYVYFCFFSMLAAQSFSLNIAYGAAAFFSISALFRMSAFTVRTQSGPPRRGAVKAVFAAFYTVSAVYIVVINPLLFPHGQAAYAAAIILLLFLEREAENLLLRIQNRKRALKKRDIAFTILPAELIFISAVASIAYFGGTKMFAVILAGAVIAMAFSFFRRFAYRDFLHEFDPLPISPDIKHVRSAGLYYGMVITSGAAFNIFAFTYILFIMFTGAHDFLFDFFIVFGGLSLAYAAVYTGTARFVNSPLIQRIGKNAAFVTGTAVAIFAVYIFRDSWFKGALMFSLQTALLLLGIILQMTATLGLKEDVLLVLKLYDKTIDEEALKQRTARLDFWTAIISETVFLSVLLLLISDPVLYAANVADYIKYAPSIGSSLIAIPTVFLFASLFYSVRQPLTEKFRRRLRQYAELIKRGVRNPDMEKRLVNVLIKKYKKRVGVYIIRAFLKRIMYHTVTGKENVTLLPGVFVFNHGELYGPIAAVVFLPYDIRPWILDKMLDPGQITGHMYEGTFGKIKFLPAFIKKAVTAILSPVVIWGLRSFDPIPVYRGAAKSVVKTFRMSVECLNSGDSILLFPENPQDTYGDDINPFYSGFAELGRLYYRKTGKELAFYPVYASKKSRTLRIGEGVRFDCGGGRGERQRVAAELETRMRGLKRMEEQEI